MTLFVVTAWAAAVVLSNTLAWWMDPGIPELVSAAASPDSAAPPAASKRARSPESSILRRDLFGAAPDDVEFDGGETTVASDSELRLRGTARADGRGYAVLEEIDSGQQGIFAVDERIFDGPRLVSVEADAVVVAARGRRRRIELTVREDEDPAGSRRPGAAPPSSGTIRRTGDGTFVVDRRQVDHSIENLNQVITQARAVPVLKDGAGIGFRLFNIRSGSIFERMGLRNGDVVQRVNGVEMNDPSKALGLLDEVQSVDEIRVDFLRGGKPRTHAYAIQ